MTKAPPPSIKVLCENRKARFNYQILDTYEAGIVLAGPEIKSVRAGKVSLEQSFVRPEGGELFLIQAHIEPYVFNTVVAVDPVRKRKLLLKTKQIHELSVAVERKGLTIVPLRLYLKRGFAKLEIALARGKNAPDKRDSVRKRDALRDAERAMKRR